MAKLPLRFINISEVKQKLLELQDENNLLKERINEMQQVINDITNITNGDNNGIEKETHKVAERQEKL